MPVGIKDPHRQLVLWVFACILLIALLRIAFFAHPMADDYCYASKALRMGSWFDAVLDEYDTWGGRYSATALMSIFALNADMTRDYWLIPVLLILTTALSFYVFFSSLHHIAGDKKDWLAWSVLSFCLYIATTPALSETVYWMAGGITYTMGYGFFLVSLGLLVRLTFSRTSGFIFILYSFLVLGSSFLVPGLNEVAAILQILAFAVGAIACFTKSSPGRYVWLTALIIGVTGLYLSIGAPGNDLRLAQLQGGVRWVTPFYGLYRGAGAIIATGVAMYLLTANRLISPLTQRLSNALSQSVAKLSRTERSLLLLCMVGFFSAVYMPGYWADGGSPPDRTKIILFILPQILWIPAIGLIMTFTGLRKIRIPWVSDHRHIDTAFAVLIFFFIAGSHNIRHILNDNVWRAKRYDLQLEERYSQIEDARRQGERNLIVAPLTSVPESMFFGDILADPDHWRNVCYKWYFGLNSIQLSH